MKKTIILILGIILLFCLISCKAEEKLPIMGSWRVELLDNKHLVLVGTYEDFYKNLCANQNICNLKSWQYKKIYQKNYIEYQPQILKTFYDKKLLKISHGAGANVGIKHIGYWLNGIGRARISDTLADQYLTDMPAIAYCIFIELDEALVDSNEYLIQLPDNSVVRYQYRAQNISALYKFNQLGFSPKAERKYAYIGAWLGDLGAYKSQQFVGQDFDIYSSATNEKVFTGKIVNAPADLKTNMGVPLNGEETLRLDFSNFNQEGEYYFYIEGIGRSHNFMISDSTIANAFFIHMRGLYHKRCGMAKSKPYTNWEVGSCHNHVIRGNFISEKGHYRAKKGQKYGFYDKDGNLMTIYIFNFIKWNTPKDAPQLAIAGGWHDAADYDRREQHFEVVDSLVQIYRMHPEKFTDNQLFIPESGNHIPDILDEAIWGLKHLQATQLANGGIGSWFETDHHPRENEYDPEHDETIFQIALPTRNSSIKYAASASSLANALVLAECHEEAKIWAESAKRAWLYAVDLDNRMIKKPFRYIVDNQEIEIYYTSPESLPVEYMLKAAINLSSYYHDSHYVESLSDDSIIDFRNTAYQRSPLMLMELFMDNAYSSELKEFKEYEAKRVTTKAKLLKDRALNDHAYAKPWYSTRDKEFFSYDWGKGHPLNQALYFHCANFVNQTDEFLDVAFLANDYHNGGNASGMSYTSGLGRVYPVRFLDLISYSDNIDEFVLGITPYRLQRDIPYNDVKYAHGMFFSGSSRTSMLPYSTQEVNRDSENATKQALMESWPIWRRFSNIEGLTVSTSEYTINETIAPAACATGLLLETDAKVDDAVRYRKPVQDIRTLPGYAPLP